MGQVLKAAIFTYSEEIAGDRPALRNTEDKYVALDLCSQALDLIDKIEVNPHNSIPDPDPLLLNKGFKNTSFRAFMAALYRDDSYLVRQYIVERFSLNYKSFTIRGKFSGNDLNKILKKFSSAQIQNLAARIYSVPFLSEIVTASGQSDGLLRKVQEHLEGLVTFGWLANAVVLPIDRRSLICIFLAPLAPAGRWYLLEQAVEAVLTSGPPPGPPHRPILDPIRALQNWFDIRRYITLNFDYQLEHSIMLDDVRATQPHERGLEWAVEEGLLEREGETGGLVRRFSDGLNAATDIYSERAVARLFEFGLNSPDYRAQILHLHGRVDRPETMLLTDSDNNRQYRRNPSIRTALEQGLDVTLTGNPVIFVGIGLTEQEITRALRALVSRGYATTDNPAFAIMAIEDSGSASWRRQMAFYRQFGIHLIPAGVPDKNGSPDLNAALKVIKELRARVSSFHQRGKRYPEAGDRTDIRIERQSLANRAKSLWFLTGNTVDKNSLWIDGPVFMEVVSKICEEFPRQPDQWTCASWRDYLDRLREKLFTYVLVETLRTLRDDFLALIKAPLLPEEYDSRAQPKIAIGTKSVNYLRVRDSQLWSDARALQNTVRRHGVSSLENMKRPPDNLAERILSSHRPIVGYFAPLGSGKGNVVRAILAARQRSLSGDQPNLVINCTFGIEFDSVISFVLQFVRRYTSGNISKTAPPITDRLLQLYDCFRVRISPEDERTPLIVLSGIERLIDREGRPIAPELDQLLTVLLSPQFARSGFRIILIAGSDCRDYITRIPFRNSVPVHLVRWIDSTEDSPGSASSLLDHVRDTAMRACDGGDSRQNLRNQLELAGRLPTRTAHVPNGARSPASEALLSLVLERWQDLAFTPKETSPLHRLRAELDRDALGSLAFIGTPIESIALLSIPPIPQRMKAIAGENGEAPMVELKNSIERLVRFGLVLHVERFDDGMTGDRIALHRSVLGEVRERYGVRSGEEQLSNSFSLTLSISMPTDLVVADIKIHSRMRDAVSRLRGSWRDTSLAGATVSLNVLVSACLRNGLKFESKTLYEYMVCSKLDRALRMLDAPMSINLRASAGIIRGFFAAASIVAQMPEAIARPDGKLGEFEEHKRRMALLVERLVESQCADRTAEEAISEIENILTSRRSKLNRRQAVAVVSLRKWINAKQKAKINEAAALYGGEVVWILNEQAVISMIQGCLRDAARLFADAKGANRLFRSPKPGGIAWRRLEINETLLRIERGHIVEARSRLLAINGEVKARAIQSEFEDDLTNPLIKNYLGLCAHLGGRYKEAEKLFDESIREADATRQQRALAVGYLRHASLKFGLGDLEGGRLSIHHGLAAAQSGRQMDIVWRARLIECAGLDRRGDQQRIEAVLRDALRYADVMDVPRISVQALREQAEHRLALEDLDGAGQSAAEAMTFAARHGMVLQRIALRVLMGRILLKKNDSSGRYLLLRAIQHADRIGYQLQVEKAERAMRETKVWVGPA